MVAGSGARAPQAQGAPATGHLAAVRAHRVGDVVAYLAIGGLAVGADVGLLVVLDELVGAPLAVATTAAFLTSVAVNFGLNRVLAGGSSGLLGRQVVRYGLLLGANLVLTVVVVVGAERLGVPYVVAKTLVVAASTLWNYVLYRRWVFATPA